MTLLLTVTLLCGTLLGTAQTSGVNQGGPDYLHAPAGLDPLPQHGGTDAASNVERMRKAESQRRVAAGAARLLQLSAELKAELDQTPKDHMSLDALRKAAEIEKVAHDLKGWMKE